MIHARIKFIEFRHPANTSRLDLECEHSVELAGHGYQIGQTVECPKCAEALQAVARMANMLSARSSFPEVEGVETSGGVTLRASGRLVDLHPGYDGSAVLDKREALELASRLVAFAIHIRDGGSREQEDP